MARPKKKGVDYFSHDVMHGKTLLVLESKWKNDGYAVWFKLLEHLGRAEGHYLDWRREGERIMLAATCHVEVETLQEILDTLAKLGAICDRLWAAGIVWSENFVGRILDAYKRRQDEIPTAPYYLIDEVSVCNNSPERGFMYTETQKNDTESAQRERESKSKSITSPDGEGSPKVFDSPTCPHQKIIEIYHEACPSLTRVRVWNETRKRNLATRWREDRERQSLDWWRGFFERVQGSDFLCGRTEGNGDRPPFVASLDWLIKPTNFAKVLEGRYDNRTGPQRKSWLDRLKEEDS